MLRVVGFAIVLFALPFAAYAAYVLTKRRTVSADVYDEAPVAWLLAAGLALSIAGLVVFGTLTGAGPGGQYSPAQLKDGVIVPGRTVAPGETAGE